MLPEKKFNEMQKWKTENGGSFKSIDEVSKVNGFSSETVENIRQFCESQLQMNQEKSNNAANHEPYFSNVNDNIYPNSFDSFFTPHYEIGHIPSNEIPGEHEPMPSKRFDDSVRGSKRDKHTRPKLFPSFDKKLVFDSFTSIYLDASAIAYTKFNVANENDSWNWNKGFSIEDWKYIKMDTQNANRIFSLYHRTRDALEQIPKSSIYIFDDHILMQRFHKSVLPAKVNEICRVNQQMAFLLAFLEENDEHCPNVFSMSYNNTGKIYGLAMGSEISSNKNIMNKILNNVHFEEHEDLNFEISNDIKDKYYKQYQIEREALGRTMLLGLTFLQRRVIKK